jgi:glycine/D-amino acid oxidase-like deaminating enzyme
MILGGGAIKHCPPSDTPSGWVPRGQLTAMGTAPAFGESARADWVVIGAGFTGLAAARRVAELRPDDSVVLIEGQTVGWGASGRNSGFVIDLPHKFDLDSNDPARLSAILRLNRTAIDDLSAHVETFGIACEWSRVGKLQGAVKERGTGKMKQFMRALEAIGEPFEELDRDAVAAITGTRHYAGAVFTPGCVLMNPVKLTRGLAASLPENVTLHDLTNVETFTRNGQQYHIVIRNSGTLAEIRTSNVLMCVNAFTPEFGYLSNRVVPVITFASMTAPLTPEQLARYSGTLDWGLTPADAAGTTFRMTQDGRLLVRNQYDYAGKFGAEGAQLDRVRIKHREAVDVRYPMFANVPFVSTWGGVCGLSRNHVAYFGKLGDGVWGSACHNGVGVARGTISGRLLAEAATGMKNSLIEDMNAVSNTPALNPPNPFLALGVRTRLKIAAWESKEET